MANNTRRIFTAYMLFMPIIKRVCCLAAAIIHHDSIFHVAAKAKGIISIPIIVLVIISHNIGVQQRGDGGGTMLVMAVTAAKVAQVIVMGAVDIG